MFDGKQYTIKSQLTGRAGSTYDILREAPFDYQGGGGGGFGGVCFNSDFFFVK